MGLTRHSVLIRRTQMADASYPRAILDFSHEAGRWSPRFPAILAAGQPQDPEATAEQGPKSTGQGSAFLLELPFLPLLAQNHGLRAGSAGATFPPSGDRCQENANRIPETQIWTNQSPDLPTETKTPAHLSSRYSGFTFRQTHSFLKQPLVCFLSGEQGRGADYTPTSHQLTGNMQMLFNSTCDYTWMAVSLVSISVCLTRKQIPGHHARDNERGCPARDWNLSFRESECQRGELWTTGQFLKESLLYAVNESNTFSMMEKIMLFHLCIISKLPGTYEALHMFALNK